MLGDESEATTNEESEPTGPAKVDEPESFADKKIAELESGIKSPSDDGDEQQE